MMRLWWRGVRLGAFLLLTFAVSSGGVLAESFPERVPEEARRLFGEEIETRMSGSWLAFKGAGGRAIGSSLWNADAGHAHGRFEWDGVLSGRWSLPWKVRDDKSCLKVRPETWICERIFAYEDGFLEVDKDGRVHTVTKPGVLLFPNYVFSVLTGRQPKISMTAREVGESYIALMAWAQKAELELLSAEESDGLIRLDLRHPDGARDQVTIDASNGRILSP